MTDARKAARTIDVERYEPSRIAEWDRFITESKNGTFLFLRRYMDYHADRFADSSLLFFDDGELAGVLPATTSGDVLVSHAGLTYGGVVSGRRMRAAVMLSIFDALRVHARAIGIRTLRYKRIPYIYHDLPAEEDLYALYVAGARLVHRDLSSAIAPAAQVPYSKGRRWSLRKAQKAGMAITESDDYDSFMAIEHHVLETKYQLRPVHTAAEMRLLAGRFPDNIKLFIATFEGRLVGGVVMYVAQHVAHAQYIAASDEGKQLGALDLILDTLISDRYAAWRFFDFGVSTEKTGRLNTNLLDNKESYGARAVVYDTYELDC